MDAEFQQNAVSRAVWPWTRPAAPPARRGLGPRAKVLIQTPIVLLIAFAMDRYLQHRTAALVVATIALTICCCGLFAPPAFRAIESVFARFGRLVAAALTWLLLVPAFFLLFGTARAMLVLRGKDPLKRAFPTGELTYWTPRPPVTRKNYYLRQH